MSEVAELKQSKSFVAQEEQAASQNELFLDRDYIDQSFPLVTDALKKGLDVVQMSNGDVMITEVKSVTYRYRWNPDKLCFERHSSHSRRGRKKTLKAQKQV